jgi:hypothetical protein
MHESQMTQDLQREGPGMDLTESITGPCDNFLY